LSLSLKAAWFGDTPLATTPPYQPHAEAPLSAIIRMYPTGIIFYFREFFTALQATHGGDGNFFYMYRKSKFSIVNFFNYIQVTGGEKAGNGMACLRRKFLMTPLTT
jgi:hypothetical protein